MLVVDDGTNSVGALLAGGLLLDGRTASVLVQPTRRWLVTLIGPGGMVGLTGGEAALPLSRVSEDARQAWARDLELARRADGGDQNAQKELHRRFYPKALRMARPLFWDALKAETAAVYAVRHLLLKIGKYKGRSSLGTWSYRVLLNELLDQRPGRRREDRPVILRIDDLKQEIPGPTTDDPAERERARRRLQAFLSRLRGDQLKAVILRHCERNTNEEIGGILKRSPAAVQMLIERAEERLRKSSKEARDD